MANDKNSNLNKGKIVSIRGPVLDIEFPPGKLPDMYNALEINRSADKKKEYQRLESTLRSSEISVWPPNRPSEGCSSTRLATGFVGFDGIGSREILDIAA